MPLSATVASVGIVVAPPSPPGRPSSWASNPAAAPGGAGAGPGGASGPGTMTSHPGRVIVCAMPFSPVIVTALAVGEDHFEASARYLD